MSQRTELEAYMNGLLAVERFKDYGPNGLQVEGRSEIKRLVSGVTASLALIEAAIEAEADAIVVHHGLFWKGQDGRVIGWMKKRLQALLARDVNLFAYHLPLDAHPVVGNNAQLGARFGLQADARFGDYDLGFIGSPPEPMTAESLATGVHGALGRAPVLVPGDGRRLHRIAWCTGGAQDWFEPAIAAGADAFITGEISEPQAHYARETGVAFLACGHHATERYGVQALAENVAASMGIEHRFIDVDNPA